jgi:hypothetical protein
LFLHLELFSVAAEALADHSPQVAEKLHRQAVAAWQRRDWEGLRALLHPEGWFDAIAADRRIVGADDFVDAMIAADATIYNVEGLSYIALSETFVVAEASVRWAMRGGGHGLSRVAWLIECREGLIFSSRPFGAVEAALKAYQQTHSALPLDLQDRAVRRIRHPADRR